MAVIAQGGTAEEAARAAASAVKAAGGPFRVQAEAAAAAIEVAGGTAESRVELTAGRHAAAYFPGRGHHGVTVTLAE